jgi:hypothetical protein
VLENTCASIAVSGSPPSAARAEIGRVIATTLVDCRFVPAIHDGRHGQMFGEFGVTVAAAGVSPRRCAFTPDDGVQLRFGRPKSRVAGRTDFFHNLDERSPRACGALENRKPL